MTNSILIPRPARRLLAALILALLAAAAFGPAAAQETPPAASDAAAAAEETSAAVARLENAGPSPITGAAVGFDSGRGRLHQFWYQGQRLSRRNPLPPGAAACTQPIPGLASGDRLAADQLGSGPRVFLGKLSVGRRFPAITLGETRWPFSLADTANGAGPVAGVFSVGAGLPCPPPASPPPAAPPPVPTGVTAAPSAVAAAIDVSWQPSGRSSPAPAGYAVYAARERTGPFVLVARLTAGALTRPAYTHAGLDDAGEYYYAVTAVNAQGEESPWSAVRSARPPDTTPPAPPSGLYIGRLDRAEGAAALDWTPNTERDLAGYRLYRQDGEGLRQPVTGPGLPATGLITALPYLDNSLPPAGAFTYAVTAVDTAGNESAPSNIFPPPADFFGTVAGFRLNGAAPRALLIDAAPGRIEALITAATEVRVPYQTTADIYDLAPGDTVAVTLNANPASDLDAYASIIQLVLDDTRNRHISGRVVRVSATEIVVQLTGAGAQTAAFRLSPEVSIRFHQGSAELEAGAFVIVVAVTASGGGELSAMAREIIVAPAPAPPPAPADAAPAAPAHPATLRGILEGLNPANANLIVSGVEVALDLHTVMPGGLAAGESLVIDAELRRDGSLLARRVERDRQSQSRAGRTIFQGVYQGPGRSPQEWLISGIRVYVDHRSYAGAPPAPGQRLSVNAIVQRDGALVAREVLHLAGPVTDASAAHAVAAEGELQRIAPDGRWHIGSLPFRVNAATELQGIPAVGQRLSVTGTATAAGGLLAETLAALEPDAPGLWEYGQRPPLLRAQITGPVQQILVNGGLVVDGLAIARSRLTREFGDTAVGRSVRVKAVIRPGGALLAEEISQTPLQADGQPAYHPVDIEGVIQQLTPGRTMQVNGLSVLLSYPAAADTDASAADDADTDGTGDDATDSVAAGDDDDATDTTTPGNNSTDTTTPAANATDADDAETDAAGANATASADATPDPLTYAAVEGTLRAGDLVQILGRLHPDGRIRAAIVRASGGAANGVPAIRIQGHLRASGPPPLADGAELIIDGLPVTLDPLTQFRAAPVIGATAAIEGVVLDGRIVAVSIGPPPPSIGRPPVEVTLQGVVDEIVRLDSGALSHITLGGLPVHFITGAGTLPGLAVGRAVQIEGLISAGVIISKQLILQPG